MIDFFYTLSPVIQTLLATSIALLFNICGASTVFLFKKKNLNMGVILSLAAGIMLASTIFSLINPALEYNSKPSIIPSLICGIAIFMGGIFLYIGDKIYNRKQKKERHNMVASSMALHNFPEGAAIGVAFGAVVHGINGASLSSAVAVALGIAIQNFPEGCALSFTLLNKGYTKTKAFLKSSLVALTEPIGALIGLYLAIKLEAFLPILLALAGGAMLYVIVVELIPDSMKSEKKELMAIYLIFGFIIMMLFDIILS